MAPENRQTKKPSALTLRSQSTSSILTTGAYSQDVEARRPAATSPAHRDVARAPQEAVDLVTATMMAICCSPPQPACCSPSIYNFNSPSLKPLDRSTQFTMMAQNKPTTSDLLRVRVGGQHDKEMKRSLAESIFEFAEGDKVRKRSAAQPKAKAANVTAAAAAAPAAEDAVQPLPLAALTTVCTPPQPQPPAASALRPSEV
eukprot:SAG25_NODE_5967_length_601_cov_0.707171_1_plen_200_part_11